MQFFYFNKSEYLLILKGKFSKEKPNTLLDEQTGTSLDFII